MRKELEIFAEEMEKVLKENDDKGGWKEMSTFELLNLLAKNYDEIRKNGINNSGLVKKCLIDMANLSMMAYDNIISWKSVI